MSYLYLGLHLKQPLSFLDLNEFEFSRQIFEKFWNIKFHKNPSSGSRVVPYGQTDGQTDRDGRTDRKTNMTKLIVEFRNFAKAPKNHGRSRDSVVDISSRLRAGWCGVLIPVSVRDFSYLGGWSSEGMNLTTHIHVAPSLRMSGFMRLCPIFLRGVNRDIMFLPVLIPVLANRWWRRTNFHIANAKISQWIRSEVSSCHKLSIDT
jgi:hypothetical protein